MRNAIFCLCVLCFSLNANNVWAQQVDNVYTQIDDITTKEEDLNNNLKLSQYDTKGVNVGTFNIKTSILTSISHDDNIYSSEDKEVSDKITSVTPTILAQSNWSRHKFAALAAADSAFYDENTDENYTNYLVSAGGRLDLFRKTFLKGSVSSARKNEYRWSPDSNQSSIKPTKYSEHAASLGFERSLRKVSLKIDEDITIFDYDNANKSNGDVVINDDRDRAHYDTSARLAYEYIPDHQIFIGGGYSLIDYTNEIPALTIPRDSKTSNVNLGTAINLGSKLKGEVFAGYIDKNYENEILEDISGLDYGLSIEWSPTQSTFVKLLAERTLEETSVLESSGIVSDHLQFKINNELRRNIILDFSIDAFNNSFQKSGSFTREDKVLFVGVGARYLVNRNFSFKLGYSYRENNSTAVDRSYEGNTFSTGIDIRF